MAKKPVKIMVRGVRYSYAIRPSGSAWTVEWSCLEPGCKSTWCDTVADRRDAETRANEFMIDHGLESHARAR